MSAHIDYRYRGESRAGATISRGDQTIGEIEYVYDAAGHLIEETWNFGEWSQSFGYEYEAVPRKLLGFSNPLVEMNSRFGYRPVGFELPQQTPR